MLAFWEEYSFVIVVAICTLALLFIIFAVMGASIAANILSRKDRPVSWAKMFEKQGVIEKNFEKKYFLKSINVKVEGGIIKVNIYGNSKNSKLVLFQHGFECTHEVGFKYGQIFFDNGFNLAAFDARGWGESKSLGFPTAGVSEKEDLHAIAKVLKHESHYKHRVLYGESMGGGSVLQYLAKYSHEKLFDKYVIDSGYVSYLKVLRQSFTRLTKGFGTIFWWIIVWGIKVKYNNRLDVKIKKSKVSKKEFRKITGDILWMHSSIERVVPIKQMKKARKWKNSSFTYVVFTKSRHVRLVLDEENKYKTTISKFLTY